MQGWRAILSEMLTPSQANESAYLWMLIAVGHAVAGAALATAMPGFVPMLSIPIGYWLIKEVHDLWRGGGWLDSIVDAAFVGLGVLYGAGWWPVAVLGAAIGGACIRAARTGP